MQVSQRSQLVEESLTLKLNSKAQAMAEEGKKVYNLTAGQLPYRPLPEFIDQLRSELDFLKSYQYSPVPGFSDLREKLTQYLETSRNLEPGTLARGHGIVVGNGGKHVIATALACLVDPGDEVVLLAPFWVSYPEMVKLYDGQFKIVSSNIFDAFTPAIADIEKAITKKTKLIIVNSPNNPSGKHYDDEWMKAFAELCLRHPHVNIMSDEIYYELNYFDPRPTYFYQHRPELLKRTIIVDGISKNMAATGLRLGFCAAPKSFVQAMISYQGQTASGANSLVQRALANLDFSKIAEYLGPIKLHLRENSNVVRDKLKEAKLGASWYQTNSAFYFLLDFSAAPVFKRFEKDGADASGAICEAILDECGVALVPGVAFGAPNTGRLSLVSQKEDFQEAMDRILGFLVQNP